MRLCVICKRRLIGRARNSSEYDFLSKAESYVNCYDIKQISVSKINQKAEYVGFLLTEDLNEILGIVRSSPANKAAVLKKFHLL